MSNTTLSTKMSGRVGSRGWAIALGLGAIVLATILLIVYLDRYRARVSGRNAPTQVFLATRTIPAGTPGNLVASQQMYAPTTLPRKDVLEGAIDDPQYLVGRAAATDIYPGRQLTAADFAASTSTTVDSQITGVERALSISIDAIHGSLGQVKAGDDVDIYIATSTSVGGSSGEEQVVKLFRPAVRILAVPGPEGGNIVLKVPTRDAADFAFAADNTRFWFVIRPTVGAKKTPDDTATKATVVAGPRGGR